VITVRDGKIVRNDAYIERDADGAGSWGVLPPQGSGQAGTRMIGARQP